MNLVSGHQPNLYPYGGFFAKLAASDAFMIADTPQYVKKQYHNRNKILLADGSEFWLAIPVINANRYKQPICEVEIDYKQNWRKKHKRTLERNYKKEPYFDKYYPYIEKLLSTEWKMLADYNIAFIKLCIKLLNISTPVYLASEHNITGKSTELIFNICKFFNAGAYLHGKHGRDYVNFEFLSENGIKNYIQTFTSLPYPDYAGNFKPNMSIIDILFKCGHKSLDYINRCNKVENLSQIRRGVRVV